MFRGCDSLVSLDISNFNTSNVENMQSMFKDCSSLVSLDLSNFNTINVQSMAEMFCDCSSLVSLNLSNFNTINVITMDFMFNDCSSLQYINLLNYIGKDIFDEISNNNNLKICINDFEQINDGRNSLKDNNVTIDCKKDTPQKNTKISLKVLLALLTIFVMIILFLMKLIIL